jgi:uncharacterized membrane protein YqiK
MDGSSLFVHFIGYVVGFFVLMWLIGVRYIPQNRVGVIERYWSVAGSLKHGGIIALNGEAGFQADILRGGLHFWLFPWQCTVHRVPLVMVSESKIGYLYARDGDPLPPTQTLAKVVACNNFQDARQFLRTGGQRGRQRAILREGVYAINLAAFVVITEDSVLSGPLHESNARQYALWQQQLRDMGGFDPVVIGHGGVSLQQTATDPSTQADIKLTVTDTVGIVTVQDGPPIESGEIIAPEVKIKDGQADHQYFQDPEAFLTLGGRRGKQLQVLTDGTFFINRWFATVEIRPKTLIPIGYVGVVVGYYGGKGTDATGDAFRYGEQVEPGERGVWKHSLPPGKYALNPYALKVELVPTVNFVLRWITGVVEAHQYDKDLSSIELITADGYEPILPLSLVLHIDYEKAPSVVQRFGDVRRLISQTLDPILSAYFRDVAQSSNMLDLLTKREEIQERATQELGRRFKEYDINCIAVMIGRPETKVAPGQEDPIERLFDQLRMRRLAEEQKATYVKQEEAQAQLQELNSATAAAAKQTELTQTRVDIEIAANRGEAQLAEARRLAQRDVARAEGESTSQELLGRGQGAKIAQVGLSEAAVFLQKIKAYGDPRLFALSTVSDFFAKSAQPIVPERLLIMGGGGGEEGKADLSGTNVFTQLLTLLLAEKAGLSISETVGSSDELQKFSDQMTKKFMAAIGTDAQEAQAAIMGQPAPAPMPPATPPAPPTQQ